MTEVGPTPTGKCINEACTFSKHVNIKNNGGLYCCMKCKIRSGQHGPGCTENLYTEGAGSSTPTAKCKSQGCTFSKHVNIKNNGGLYCCMKCKITSGQHGVACEEKMHVEEVVPTEPITGST